MGSESTRSAKCWDSVPIGEKVTLRQGLAINRKTKDLLQESGLPLLRIADLQTNSFSQFVDPLRVPEKCVAWPQDVIYTRTGRVGLVFRGLHGVVHNNCFRVLPNEGDLLPEYIYWFLSQKSVASYANSVASGSVQKDLNHAAFNTIQIPLPPLPEQRRIAAVLGALDDKIELNRQMNRTLEAMATALFKSWFIDFDGHDDLVDSELGPIPRGWEVRPLAEFARLVTTSVKPFSEPARLWEHFSIPSFDDGRLPALDKGDEIKSNKYAVPEDAVLVSKLNPRFPRIWMPNVTSLQSAICSTEFMPFVPSDKSNRSFLFEYFWSSAGQHALCSRVSGTTGSRQRAKPKEIAVMPFLVPSTQQLRHFAAVAGPMNQQRLRHISESRTLAQLRDTLLPKLISGELRVPEAERQIEAAL